MLLSPRLNREFGGYNVRRSELAWPATCMTIAWGMLNQPSTWNAPVWTFRRSTIGLALFGSLVLGCPGPEPSASGAGGSGGAGNGGQGGEDKGSSSSGSLGGEGGGGMSTSGGGMSAGGMNSGGESPCGLAELVDCGCGFVCAFPSLTTTPECTMPGTCQLKCNEYQHDFVPDSAEDPMSWGCETRGRRVFVTKQQLPAEMLEGVAGADDKCQMIADAKVLGGTWKAWLSDEQNEPLEDFEQSPDPYYLLDGTLVAEDFAHLTSVEPSNLLFSPINRDQDKMLVPNAEAAVWTGTSPIGVFDLSCGDWGLNPGLSSVGRVGNASEVDARWTFDGVQLCGNAARLYCFEQ